MVMVLRKRVAGFCAYFCLCSLSAYACPAAYLVFKFCLYKTLDIFRRNGFSLPSHLDPFALPYRVHNSTFEGRIKIILLTPK